MTWCARCGGAVSGSAVSGGGHEGGGHEGGHEGGHGGGGHEACTAALALEPPRFCPRCRRRMKVQVLPAGWVATCAEHGETRG